MENIAIGNHVIIDSFCSIIANGPGELRIGSYIHIGAFCHLLANDGIDMGDFSGLSQGVKIYSRTDDYSGNSLTNPTIPNKYKNIKKGKVTIGEHVIIGANSIVLPKLHIPEGVSIGALSLVSTSLDSWTMYMGNPLKKIIKRSQKLLEKREAFLRETKND